MSCNSALKYRLIGSNGIKDGNPGQLIGRREGTLGRFAAGPCNRFDISGLNYRPALQRMVRNHNGKTLLIGRSSLRLSDKQTVKNTSRNKRDHKCNSEKRYQFLFHRRPVEHNAPVV